MDSLKAALTALFAVEREAEHSCTNSGVPLDACLKCQASEAIQALLPHYLLAARDRRQR